MSETITVDLAPHEREVLGIIDEDAEDIGDTSDLDGDGVPDELDVEDLDDLVAEAPDEPELDFDPVTPEEDD